VFSLQGKDAGKPASFNGPIYERIFANICWRPVLIAR